MQSRTTTVAYMRAHADTFETFAILDGVNSYTEYCDRMAQEGSWVEGEVSTIPYHLSKVALLGCLPQDTFEPAAVLGGRSFRKKKRRELSQATAPLQEEPFTASAGTLWRAHVRLWVHLLATAPVVLACSASCSVHGIVQVEIVAAAQAHNCNIHLIAETEDRDKPFHVRAVDVDWNTRDVVMVYENQQHYQAVSPS